MTSAGVVLLLAGCTTSTSAPAPVPSPSLVAPPRAEEETGGDALGIVGHRSAVRLADPVGDVWLVRRRDRAPQRLDAPGIDLVSTTVRHARTQLLVRAVFASSAPSRGVLDVGVGTTAGRWFADVPLTGGPETETRFVSPTGSRVGCVGSVSERRGAVLTVHLPRSCLDQPAWVTVRVLVSARTGDGTAYENAHNARPFAEAGTGRLYPPS